MEVVEALFHQPRPEHSVLGSRDERGRAAHVGLLPFHLQSMMQPQLTMCLCSFADELPAAIEVDENGDPNEFIDTVSCEVASRSYPNERGDLLTCPFF